MDIYDKIILSNKMLKESERIYESATCTMDYIKSILLSGSVIGIIVPLLKERKIKTDHEYSAELYSYIFKEKCNPSVFNSVYNSLKHTGNKKKEIEAWNDINFEGCFPSNAKYLLKAAQKDMSKLDDLSKSHNKL